MTAISFCGILDIIKTIWNNVLVYGFFFVEKIVLGCQGKFFLLLTSEYQTTEETIMQSSYWEDFYRSGKVSDYLKYVDSARNAAEGAGEFTNKDAMSGSMESVQYAGKSDGNRAVGNAGW